MIGCGGCVINIFTRIGIYIEKHWPEKMTSEEVKAYFNKNVSALIQSLAFLDKRVYDLEARIIKLNSEIETLKTQTTVKSRIAGSTPSAMTPFASKFPINGGNQSPR